MVAVGYDTAFIEHHFSDRIDVIACGYCKQPMTNIVFINEIDKWTLAGSVLEDFLGDFFLVFVEHKNPAELRSGCPF